MTRSRVATVFCEDWNQIISKVDLTEYRFGGRGIGAINYCGDFANSENRQQQYNLVQRSIHN